jgi:hypothetical protein
MEKPWPWWVIAPVFVLVVAAFWGMWALPLIWGPLIIVPVAVIAVAITGAFKGNLRSKK